MYIHIYIITIRRIYFVPQNIKVNLFYLKHRNELIIIVVSQIFKNNIVATLFCWHVYCIENLNTYNFFFFCQNLNTFIEKILYGNFQFNNKNS